MTIAPAALPQKNWDTKEIVAWIRTERQYAERHREPWLRLFLQCLRFWAGDHWRDVVESTLSRWDSRQIRPIGTEDFRLTDNQIPTYCRQLTATATANMPKIRAMPADAGDPEDVAAAQIGSVFIEWRDLRDNEDLQRELAWLWMLGTGETLRYTGLDAEGGEPQGANALRDLCVSDRLWSACNGKRLSLWQDDQRPGAIAPESGEQSEHIIGLEPEVVGDHPARLSLGKQSGEERLHAAPPVGASARGQPYREQGAADPQPERCG